MDFTDKTTIVIEVREPDGYGGFITTRNDVGTIKVKVAPYRVANGEMIAIPNPIASVKFFTNSKLPVDDEELFFLRYNGKFYKKVALTNYGKCILIIGERYEN
ncbi:MAG: hypothetical protein ACI3T9_01460 [Romboutsia timonensis]